MNITKNCNNSFKGTFQIHGANTKKEVKQISSKYKDKINKNKELSINAIEFMESQSARNKVALLPDEDKIILDTIHDIDKDMLYLKEPILTFVPGQPNQKYKLSSEDKFCKVSNKKGEFNQDKISEWLNYLIKKTNS